MRVLTSAATVVLLASGLSACSKTAACIAGGPLGCALAVSADNSIDEKRSGRALPENASGRIRLGGMPQADTQSLRLAAESAEQQFRRERIKTVNFYDSELREMLLNKTLLVERAATDEDQNPEVNGSDYKQQVFYLAPNGEMKSWHPQNEALSVGEWGVYKNFMFCMSFRSQGNEDDPSQGSASCTRISVLEEQIKSSQSGDALKLMHTENAPFVWSATKQIQSITDLVGADTAIADQASDEQHLQSGQAPAID